MLSTFFLAFNVSYAQSHQDLKGPAAKNYKPWKQQARTGALVVRVDEKEVKGPAYKNRKPWQDDANKSEVTSELRVREKITGPKAKNKKPWQND
ncbi:MAG: hypothetical protein WD426_02445 [Anditalea sp.]